MLAFIKRLLCRHRDLTFVRNLYGDQIIHAGYKRSEWKCNHCGAWVLKGELHHGITQRADGGEVE